jgi:salicylate hydroxylase
MDFVPDIVPMEEARQNLDENLLTKVPIYCGLGRGINCIPIHGRRHIKSL